MRAENVCCIPADNTPPVTTCGKTDFIHNIDGREAVILALKDGV
jgi:hypothetical protein